MVNASVMALTLGVATMILISSAPVIFNSTLRMNQQQKQFYVITMKE